MPFFCEFRDPAQLLKLQQAWSENTFRISIEIRVFHETVPGRHFVTLCVGCVQKSQIWGLLFKSRGWQNDTQTRPSAAKGVRITKLDLQFFRTWTRLVTQRPPKARQARF
jgi:hypothetical protein